MSEQIQIRDNWDHLPQEVRDSLLSGPERGKTMSPYAVIESGLTMNTLSFQIRVWRQEESLDSPMDNWDIEQAIRNAESTSKCCTAKDFTELVAKMPRVNAVEVKDRLNGKAVIIYTEWP